MSEIELYVANWIASKLCEKEKRQLLSDIQNASVNRELSTKFCRVFDIDGYQRPTYEGQEPYSVEAAILDKNGNELGAILFMDQNGRLLELEWLDYGDSDITTPVLDTISMATPPKKITV